MIPLAAAAAAPRGDTALQISGNGGGSAPVKLFLVLTALSFATALLVSVTSFTRIVIVLSFLRQALGTPQLPPNQVMIG
ncbi:MAG TPA: flagellar biosynthetic protein FliP, partial [Anaeromyxobacter sp.]|nr:flagellar biosynthetic protein FliP [Anaeromyxobacter sp.]